MKRKEEEIFKKLSERADQFELPVEDFVWDAVLAAAKPEKKKRRFGFWWFFISGLVLLSLILLSISSLTSDFAGNLSAGKDRNLIEGNMNASYLAIESSVSNGNERDDISILDPIKNKLASGELQNQVDSGPIDNNSNMRSVSTPSITNQNSIATPINSSEILDRLDSTELAPMNQIGVDITLHNNSEEYESFDSLNLNALNEDAFSSDLVPDNDEELDEADVLLEIPIQEKKNDRRFSLLLHGGVGQSFRVLNSDTHHDLITHKNEHETFGGCFEMGLDAQFIFNNRFIGRTGLGYKFYSDKYDFQHDLIAHTTRNDYQYLQVPLIAGFNLLPKSKSNLYVLGGVRANLLTSAQSSWVDVSALAPVAHNNASANTPFRVLTAALNLGLDYNFNLTDKFSVHFIPSVDAFLNSVYKRKTDLNQRPYSVNFDLGISYSF